MSSNCKPIKMLAADKSKKSEGYACHGNSCEILKKISTFFGDEKYCDVTLISGDNQIKLKAHRMILAASSEYFSAMFGGSMKEAEAKEVKFDQIDGHTLKAVINSIYTSSIELEPDTVENIAKAAHLFQLDSLELTCYEYLTKQLDPSNCLGIALFAERYNCTTLYEKSFEYVANHFMALRNKAEFFQLDADQLCKFLSSDMLRVPNEKEVFHSLMTWVEYDKTNREKCIAQLIQCVRLALLPPKFIADTVEPACKFIKCKELIYEAYKWHSLPILEHSLLSEEQTKLRSLKDVIIAISGWNNTECALSVGIYYAEFQDWIYREWPRLPEYRFNFGSTTVGDKLIIAGGKLTSGQASNRVDCLDLKTLKWTTLTPLISERHSCGMITLDGKVYVVGGTNTSGALQHSVEKWDPLTARWQSVANMPYASSNPCVGIKSGLLCVSYMYNSYKRLQIYSPSSNTWSSDEQTEIDLLGMATVSINEVDHFFTVSKTKIINLNLQNNTTTVAQIDLQFSKNCTVFGDRLIVYGANQFKEYGNCGAWKSMPTLKNQQGGVILFSV